MRPVLTTALLAVIVWVCGVNDVAGQTKEELEKELQILKLKLEIEKAKAELEAPKIRKKVESEAVDTIHRNGAQILNQAYPFAFNKLKYSSSELIGLGQVPGSYTVTVQVNYLNLLEKRHYVRLAVSYDLQGGYLSQKFSGHSDVIAPEQLTLDTIFKKR